MTHPKIVLYSSVVCPFAQRTWMALELASAKYEYKEVNLHDKPDWFLAISPTGKVPTVAVDGEIFFESVVTTELVANLYPEAGLKSSDPLVAARSALWADRFTEHVTPFTFLALHGTELTAEQIHTNFFEGLNKALPYLGKTAPFAAGQSKPLLGDITIAPFIGRILLQAEAGFLPKSIVKTLEADASYAKFGEYVNAIRMLPAFEKTFNSDRITELFAKRVGEPKFA